MAYGMSLTSVVDDEPRSLKKSPTVWAVRNVLLDTSFLIDLMDGDEGAVEKARELERDLVQQRLSLMTLFELYYGIARAIDSEPQRETVEQVLASKPIHPADAAVMQKAGRCAGELQKDGTPVGDGDLIIAATARILEDPVLTRNHGDFDRLGVDIESY